MADVKRIALVAAIAVFFTVLVIAGMDLFLTKPEYSDYCRYPYAPFETKLAAGQECPQIVQEGPALYEDCTSKNGDIVPVYDNSTGCVSGYRCDICRAGYEEDFSKYRLLAFAISVVFGTAAVIFGVLSPAAIESIGSGALYGGLLLLVYGTFAYGDLSNKHFRFFALAFDLAIIVWATWTKIEKGRLKKVRRK